MKKKILILVITVFFIVGIILLSIFLNNRNKVEISNEEVSTMEVIKVTSVNFEEEVLNSDKTVLIDFYADWCGPCKMIGPVVEELANENADIKVVKVNVDDNSQIAAKYQVMSIPTLIVIENGQVVNQSVGLISKSEILDLIK